jgi:hypothetical protein
MGVCILGVYIYIDADLLTGRLAVHIVLAVGLCARFVQFNVRSVSSVTDSRPHLFLRHGHEP